MEGDAHGVGVDPRWQAAVTLPYFMPSGVKVAYDELRGPVLTTADGMTIYRRDFSYHTGGASRSVPYTFPGSPVMGRAVGVEKACSGKCLKSWRPLRASKDATPSGYWEVATRADDGSRQWVYKGYALYTYAGDKAPGDVNGNDIFDLPAFNEKKQSNDLTVIGLREATVLYWTFAAP